jgi:nitrite reductase (NADH) small subunit
MSEFVDLGSTSEVPEGRAVARTVGERTIAIYHTASGFFATDNVCPHRGGPLAEGDLIGDEINCPWHLWGFDVKTGLCAGNREISVSTHEVRIVDGRILVKP